MRQNWGPDAEATVRQNRLGLHGLSACSMPTSRCFKMFAEPIEELLAFSHFVGVAFERRQVLEIRTIHVVSLQRKVGVPPGTVLRQRTNKKHTGITLFWSGAEPGALVCMRARVNFKYQKIPRFSSAVLGFKFRREASVQEPAGLGCGAFRCGSLAHKEAPQSWIAAQCLAGHVFRL